VFLVVLRCKIIPFPCHGQILAMLFGRSTRRVWREKRNFAAMEQKKILLIGDLVGYGDLGMTAMIPILSHKGHAVMNLPTALVSNNFAYRKYGITDTTDYMRQTLKVWQELGFAFDAVATGFIASEEQARMLSDYCQRCSQAGTPMMVDPIMADGGKLYSGISDKIIGYMRRLTATASLIIPNYTEACYLAGAEFKSGGMRHGEALELTDSLRRIGTKSVLITSAIVDGQTAVVGYDNHTDEHFTLPYDEIPVALSGTGDIFSSVLLSHLLVGEPLKTSAQAAMDVVYSLIEKNRDTAEPFRGIVVSRYLDNI